MRRREALRNLGLLTLGLELGIAGCGSHRELHFYEGPLGEKWVKFDPDDHGY